MKFIAGIYLSLCILLLGGVDFLSAHIDNRSLEIPSLTSFQGPCYSNATLSLGEQSRLIQPFHGREKAIIKHDTIAEFEEEEDSDGYYASSSNGFTSSAWVYNQNLTKGCLSYSAFNSLSIQKQYLLFQVFRI